uniref:Uncharacterized protein n=1 Tax=Ditylenchus dipsaci TaxID=166011 RepID=A0A915DYU4_9BILA
MTESTSAMTSAADRPQEFSIDEPEENEKKPFYKSTLFIVIAAIILLALLLGIVMYFTLLKQSDAYGASETPAPSTDASNLTEKLRHIVVFDLDYLVGGAEGALANWIK